MIQFARIGRDYGFCEIQEVASTGAVVKLDSIGEGLRSSLAVTDEVLSEKFIGQLEHTESAVARGIIQEVFDVRGSTLGRLGRLTTVREVLLHIDPRGDGPIALQERGVEQRPYGEAHGELRKGSDGLELVDNAMNGARQEIINGQRLRAAKWMVRASAGLAWTARHDRRNLAAARLAFAGRLPHLRSYDAARASVLVKP